MSEYQYYEFRTVGRTLDDKARASLQAISSRGTLTDTSFVNVYNYGDFRGDPIELTRRYFDLFLYMANWGTRRLAMRVPAGQVSKTKLAGFALCDDVLTLWSAGSDVIVDICVEDVDAGVWLDCKDELPPFVPLR